MHILIEDYEYSLSSSPYFSNKAFVDDLDSEFYNHKNGSGNSPVGTVSFKCVGYFFSPSLHDCVIVLPKVLIVRDEQTMAQRLYLSTDELTPEDIFDLDNLEGDPDCVLKTAEIRQELRAFGVWIFRALKNYFLSNPQNSIISRTTTIPTRIDNSTSRSGSLLEVILDLLKYNREHQPFLSRVIVNSHSGSRIKWNKTISRSTPIIQNEVPYYIDPIRKKTLPNHEEELIIIFYSILHYIEQEFGFHYNKVFEIPIIPDNIFLTFIKGRGVMRLRQIKNKYFSTDALRLWDLCMAFFNELHALCSTPHPQQHLLAKSFHQVFEDMVDFLIGDNVEKKFRVFKDRRQIDHIYLYDSLIGEGQHFYIGDSKYYSLKKKNGRILADMPDDSVHKQYVYALNVQQLLMEKPSPYPDIFDPVTEGYQFIPNFFISGSLISSTSAVNLPYSFKYNENGIEIVDKIDSRMHFSDRLFDSNTLKLFYFNVNFMFILKAYALGNKWWGTIARAAIRMGIRDMLLGNEGLYRLYTLAGNISNIADMPWSDYRRIAGKIIKLDHKFYLAVRRPSKGADISSLRTLLTPYETLLKYGIKAKKYVK